MVYICFETKQRCLKFQDLKENQFVDILGGSIIV